MNVILISLDATRADGIGPDEKTGSRSNSPAIDSLGRRGAVFDRMYSNAVMTPQSHLSIFTGLYPTHHKALLHESPSDALRADVPTIPELLHRQGFATAWFARMDNGQLNPALGFARGFDEMYNQEFDQDQMPDEKSGMERVRDWIKSHSQKPFFLFLHSWRPHSPYLISIKPDPLSKEYSLDNYKGRFFNTRQQLAHRFNTANMNALLDAGPLQDKTSPFHTLFWKLVFFNDIYSKIYWSSLRLSPEEMREDRDFLWSSYRGAIARTDLALAELFSQLDQLSLTEKTVIILTADHGEEFLEHGNFFHQTAYNENLHVPLVIFAPGSRFQHGIKISRTVESTDLLPTILDLEGLRPLPYSDGESLFPLLEGKDMPSREKPTFSYTHLDRVVATLQNKRWKLMDEAGFAPALYDLTSDPKETRNIYSSADWKIPELKRLGDRFGFLLGHPLDGR